MNEMILSQINEMKISVSNFINILSDYSKSNKLISITQQEKNFFEFISKQILFLREVYSLYPLYILKVLISDYYNYILCIIRTENRYMYLNERSIIESYTRWILSTTVEQNHVTSELIAQLKKHTCTNGLTDAEYSLIKSEYVISCGFIHGSRLLNSNLSYVFKECISNYSTLKNINCYFQKIIRIIKIFNRLVISNMTEQIDAAFWNKKSVLEYLIGKENVNILFQLRK